MARLRTAYPSPGLTLVPNGKACVFTLCVNLFNFVLYRILNLMQSFEEVALPDTYTELLRLYNSLPYDEVYGLITGKH